MPLRHEEAAAEFVGGVLAARSVAHEAVGEQIARRKERLRSKSKTRKSARTRARIMSEACGLMAERGNTNFQMGEVSERCEMSKGSLYYYFADKDELISAIFDEQVDDLVDGMEEVAARSASAHEALSGLYSEFVSRLRAGSLLALAMTYEIAGSRNQSVDALTSRFSRATKVVAAQVERAKIEGLVREDVDGTVAAIYMTGGLLTTSLLVASRQMEDDPEVIAQNLLNLILHGIAEGGGALA